MDKSNGVLECACVFFRSVCMKGLSRREGVFFGGGIFFYGLLLYWPNLDFIFPF